jgi:hypothetical protein
MLPFLTKRCDRSKWSFALEAVTVSLLGFSTYWLYKRVQSYGWNGTIRYIWEGDPLPQEIRQLVDVLQAVSQSLDKIEAAIFLLEEGLERARLDTVDGTSPANILQHWRTNLHHTKQEIRKDLAKMSFDLDVIASKIDQIPTKEEVRQQKKELSSRTVLLMSRADQLIDFFTTATTY